MKIQTYAVGMSVMLALLMCAGLNAASTGKFVTAEGKRLKLNGEDFYFSGGNTYSMLDSERSAEAQFEIAKELGLNALRIWGFWNGEVLKPQLDEDGNVVKPATPETDEWGRYVLQSKPREYPEQGWRRLDYVIYLANIYDVKLIIPLMNEWPEFGGLDTYMYWANDLDPEVAATIADLVENRKNMMNLEYELAIKNLRGNFWNSDDAKGIYFDYVRQMMNRVNTFTGVAYKDDPAIMIWEVMNEPRFGPWAGDKRATKIRDFLKEASELIKSLDSNHLVGTGEEGFLRTRYSDLGRTTYPWTAASGEGVDFVMNSQIETIDVLGFHCWPFQWSLWGASNDDLGDKDFNGEYPDLTTFGPEWVEEHIRLINEPQYDIGKPLYLGEFGFQILRQDESDPAARSTVSYRNEIMQPIYDSALHEDIAGVAFWSMTSSTDMDYVTYDGPIERSTLLQAYFSDDAVPHDLAFYFDVFCPQDVGTCAMIKDFSEKKLVNNVNNPPYVLPCVAPRTQCGEDGDMSTCVLLDSHPDHCGVCGNVCGDNESCTAGICEPFGDGIDDDSGAGGCSTGPANRSFSIWSLLI